MIQVQGLSKVYSNGKGIFDLSFEIRPGEVFGYLGPNGAGKTTTIRHLLGFTNATKGSSSIHGLDCRGQADQIQKFLGYIPGEIAFMNDMNGIEFLKFMREMRSQKDVVRCEVLVKRFDLDTKTKIRKMSKGMKQKLGIVTAFMHDPEVLILDEPTSGLDPLMQQVFVDLVREEKARGKTFLISSHMFDEVARTCDRAGIIREGKLVAIEDIHALMSSQSKRFSVTLSSESEALRLLADGFESELTDKNRVLMTVHDNYDAFIAALSKYKVLEIDVLSSELEDVFMKYYR